MNHTKGEWKYDEELSANMSMISGDETIVCGLPNPVTNEVSELEEMRANAQLIAKSPQLAEMLAELLDAIGNPMGIPPYEVVEKASKLLQTLDL